MIFIMKKDLKEKIIIQFKNDVCKENHDYGILKFKRKTLVNKIKETKKDILNIERIKLAPDWIYLTGFTISECNSKISKLRREHNLLKKQLHNTEFEITMFKISLTNRIILLSEIQKC